MVSGKSFPSDIQATSARNGNLALDALMVLLSSLNLSKSDNEMLIDMLSERVNKQLDSLTALVPLVTAVNREASTSIDEVDGAIITAPRTIQVNNAILTDPPMISVLSDRDTDYSKALAALADDCTLSKFKDVYYNLPVEQSPPFYCVIRGLHIGVFAGWDIAGPKVKKVSGTVYAGCSSLEVGERKVRQAIERGDVKQVPT